MKIRKGFVSNSSSSSFVCDITGTVDGGYDCCLSDAYMVECEKGHTFLYVGFEEVESWVNSDENEDSNYGLPEALCPVCNGAAKPLIVKRFKENMKNLGITIKDLK